MAERPPTLREVYGDTVVEGDRVIISDQLAHIGEVLERIAKFEGTALDMLIKRENRIHHGGPQRETMVVTIPPLPPPPGKADPTRNEQKLVNVALNAYVRGLHGDAARRSAIDAGRLALRQIGFETEKIAGSYVLTSSPL